MKKNKRISKTVKIFAKVILLTIIMILLSNIVDIIDSKKYDAYSYSRVDSILVKSGDTLWGIAHKIDTVGSRDTRWTVEEIKLLNKMTTSDIQIGQSLIVPVFEDSQYWDNTEAPNGGFLCLLKLFCERTAFREKVFELAASALTASFHNFWLSRVF